MNVQCIKPEELSADQIQAWRDLQRRSATAESPFFSPTFTLAASRAQANLEVAVVNAGDRLVGFLPFQRRRFNVGRPVAWKLNDFQGGVFDESAQIDGEQLIRRAGLAAWHFDHLLATQSCFRRGQIVLSESPYIDLSGGFEQYLAGKKAAKAERVCAALRKARKIERELGDVRFEFDCDDQRAFDLMLGWKREQLKQMNAHNMLDQAWAVELLNPLRRSDNEDCRGTLSVLYAGNNPVAAHFGIRNERVLHWWVTCYDKQYERYSPGAILLLELVRHAAALGIRKIDLGKGQEPYKTSFQTGATQLAEGAVACSAWRRSLNAFVYRGKDWVRTSPARGLAQWPKQVLRKIAGM